MAVLTVDNLHLSYGDNPILKGVSMELAPGTEVIGAQLVSLWQGGAIDVVAALSVINIVLVGIGLALALRLGVRLRD